MKRNSLGLYKILLVTLITSLSITGISFLDDKIRNIVMLVIGMIAYSIVGLLFSLRLISRKNAGKEAYIATFIILVILGYCVYSGIIKLQQWILSWPLYAKIIVPSAITCLILAIILLIVLKSRRSTKDDTKEDQNKGL